MLSLAGVASASAASAEAVSTSVPKVKIKVAVSILPQMEMVRRIGGERVEVASLLRPGDSPSTTQLRPRQLQNLLEADLYFKMGLPFEERLLEKLAQSPGRYRLVDMRSRVPLLKMEFKHTHDHEHEHYDSHSHEEDVIHEQEHAASSNREVHQEHDDFGHSDDSGSNHPAVRPHENEPAETIQVDPHIWLDPGRVKIMATTIRDALIEIDPDAAAFYTAKHIAYMADLSEVDRLLADLFNKLPNKTFYVYHPAFGYFADAYGLKQIAVETGGKEPSARELAQLIEQAREDNVKVIFVQKQFPRKAAWTLANAIGGIVVDLDPLDPDLLESLRTMGMKIQTALSVQ